MTLGLAGRSVPDGIILFRVVAVVDYLNLTRSYGEGSRTVRVNALAGFLSIAPKNLVACERFFVPAMLDLVVICHAVTPEVKETRAPEWDPLYGIQGFAFQEAAVRAGPK